jgi:hypothetical protein
LSLAITAIASAGTPARKDETMNRNVTLRLATAGLTVTLGLGLLLRVYADPLLFRYPEARSLGSEQVDFSRLGHGWVERQAAYHTGAEMTTVGLWYLDQLEVGPEDEVHNAGDCVWLRTVRQVLKAERTTEVRLCRAVYGTSIAVHEILFLSP